MRSCARRKTATARHPTPPDSGRLPNANPAAPDAGRVWQRRGLRSLAAPRYGTYQAQTSQQQGIGFGFGDGCQMPVGGNSSLAESPMRLGTRLDDTQESGVKRRFRIKRVSPIASYHFINRLVNKDEIVGGAVEGGNRPTLHPYLAMVGTMQVAVAPKCNTVDKNRDIRQARYQIAAGTAVK